MARIEYPPKATHAQTRAHNASLVLRALYDLGPITRADIARLTGLTRTSVGELVADLEAEGLAREVGRGPSTGGKQPTLVALVDDARTVIVLDLGERTFSAALAEPPRRAHDAPDPRPRRPRRRRRARARPRPHRRRPPRGDEPDPRHRRRHAGHRRRRTARSAGRSTSTGRTCPSPTLLSERHGLPTVVANDCPRGGPRDVPLPGRRPAAEPHRRPRRTRHRRRPDPARPAVRRRRRGRRRDRPRRRRARWRRVPLRPVRLPRDGRQRRRRSFAPRPPAGLAGDRRRRPSWPSPPRRGDAAALAVTRAAGRALGAAIADLTGALDVRHIMVLGTVDGPRRAVVRGHPRRGRAPQPRPARPRDPIDRRRHRRGRHAARRVRPAADPRARPDGAPMSDRATAAGPVAGHRHRRHQDRRPRRRRRRRRPWSSHPLLLRGRPGRRRRGHRRAASTTRSPPPASSAGDLRAVGVGVPGRVDPAQGTVTLAVNLGWHDFPLRAALEAAPRPPGHRRERRPRRGHRPARARRPGRPRRPRLPRGRDRHRGRRRPRRHAPPRRPRPRRRDRPRHRRPRRPGLRLRPARLPRGVRLRPGHRPPRPRGHGQGRLRRRAPPATRAPPTSSTTSAAGSPGPSTCWS